MDISSLYARYLQHPSIQTDSRKIKPGDIFVALKGPNFNGNAYAKQALADGAACCIVDEPVDDAHDKIIRVSDCLETLQALALHHRRQFSIPFIAITGSNGKTTTKELLHAVLSTRYKTYTTVGNLNNHIGVPLTLLKIRQDAEMAIVEMGANHQKEIESYCRYTEPTHGLITNCGKAHLEGFGGIEGVRKGKGELFDYLRTHGGMAFVNWDYDYLQSMSQGISSIFRYGSHAVPELDIAGETISSDPFLKAGISKGLHEQIEIQTQLVGDYNLPNLLAAVAVGKYFAVSDQQIREALENYLPENSRSQMITRGSNQIILDAYNANPNSMKAAVENMAKLPHPKKIIILGAMMELGNDSDAEHRQLVKLLEQYSWDRVILVGKSFAGISGNYLHFEKTEEAAEWFKKQQPLDTLILLKGSRSMQMEKLLD